MKTRLARMLTAVVSVACAAAVIAPGSAAAKQPTKTTTSTTSTSTTSTSTSTTSTSTTSTTTTSTTSTSTATVQHYCSTGYTLTAASTTTAKYDANKDGYVCVKVINKRSSSYADDFSQLLMM